MTEKRSRPVTKKQVQQALEEGNLTSAEDYKTLLNRLLDDSSDLDEDYKDIQLVYDGEDLFDRKKLEEYGVDLESANFLDMRSIMDNISLGYLGEFGNNSRLLRAKSRYYNHLARRGENGVVMEDGNPSVEQNHQVHSMDRRDSDAFDHAINKMLQDSDWWLKFQQKEVHETQLHGLSFAVWEDNFSSVPKLYPRYRVKVTAKTPTDLSTWSVLAIESTYSVQDLYQFYLNSTRKKTEKDKKQGWKEEALAEYLFWHSKYRKKGYSALKQNSGAFTATAVDYCLKLRSGVQTINANYDDDFILYNIYRKEIDGSITRVIIDRDLKCNKLLYERKNDRKSFADIIYPFTRKSWLEFLVHQVGIGHDIYGFQQIIQELLSYSVNNAKIASGIIINSPEGENRSGEPVDIIPGIGINAGDNQITSASLGTNLTAVVNFITVLQNKLTTNLITSGYNININDIEFSNDKQLDMFALREARSRKNIFSLYYQNLRGFFRVYIGKLLKDKKSADYERFSDYLFDKGVDIDSEVNFLRGEKDEYGVPRTLNLHVSKTHGTGSQFADRLMADKLMAVSGSFSAEEQQKTLELYIQANSTPEIAEEFNLSRIKEENSRSKDKHFAIMSVNMLEEGLAIPESSEFDPFIFADTYIQRCVAIIKAWSEDQYGEVKVYVAPEYQHLEGIPQQTPSEQAFEALFNIYSGALFYTNLLKNNPMNKQVGIQFESLLGELLNPIKEIEARARTDAEARQAAIQERLQNASEIKEEGALKQIEVMSKIQRENALTQSKIQQRTDMNEFNKLLKRAKFQEEAELDRLKIASNARVEALNLTQKNIFEQQRRLKGGQA